MRKKSKNLISKARADALFEAFSTLTLNTVTTYWMSFKNNEKNLYPKIMYLIDRNAKAFVSNLIKFSQEEPIEDSYLDDYIPTAEDHIEDALKVSKLYTNSSNAFKGIFLFGLYAGRAMSQVEFEASHSLNEILKPNEDMLSTTEDQIDKLEKIASSLETDIQNEYEDKYFHDLDEETLQKNYEEIMKKLGALDKASEDIEIKKVSEKDLEENYSEEEILEIDSQLMKDFFNAIMKMYSDDEESKD